MTFDSKRKRWNIDDFLNIAPSNISKSKFKYENGCEKSYPNDLLTRSDKSIYKIQNFIMTVPPIIDNKNDPMKSIMEKLCFLEKIELKKLDSNTCIAEKAIEEENSFDIISNKANELIKKINENKIKIVSELEKNSELNKIITEVDKTENAFRDVYRQKIIYKNDIDSETNRIFERFQVKINELNMNPLKQQYNNLLKGKKNLENSIYETMKNDLKLRNQIEQNTSLLSTIRENLMEFEKKILEKTNTCLEENLQIKLKFKETFKNMIEIRFLKEQINILKNSPKSYCIIKQKNLVKKNVFNYEAYLKISKSYKFLTLFGNEKFMNPLRTVPKTILEENFHTPMKEKNHFDDKDEENPIKKCMSESNMKLLKNNHIIKKATPNQGSYKFDAIIDNQYHNFYFNENYAKKLYFELEVFLKGSFIRNWETLLKNVSFNNLDYDFFLNLKNDFTSYKKIFTDDDFLNNLQNKFLNKMEIEEFDEKIFKKEKQEYFEKHLNTNYYNQAYKKTFNLPPINILFTADKERGLFYDFIQIMLDDLIKFENKIIKIGNVKYSFDSTENIQQFSSNNIDDILLELRNKCNEKNERKKILILNLFFDIYHKNELTENSCDSKRISLILFNLSQIENVEIFFKHLLNVLTKEKLSVQKDKNVELIENLLKTNSKLILINELPNLLKNNKNSFNKYEKIQRILEFNKKMTN